MMEKHQMDYPDPQTSSFPQAPPTFDEAVYGKSSRLLHRQTEQPTPGPPPPATVLQPVYTVTATVVLGPNPTNIQCPHCRNSVITRIEQEAATLAHIACFVLFLVGCWPCCFIPYCMDSFQNVKHTCPSCGNFLGEYKP